MDNFQFLIMIASIILLLPTMILYISRLNYDVITSIKIVKVKKDLSEWGDGEIAEKIHTWDKLCKRVERTKFYVDKDIYKETQIAVQSLV